MRQAFGAGCACAAVVLTLATGAATTGAAAAADSSAWKTFHLVDAVTDQVRDGVAFDDGEDGVRIVCTHQRPPDTRRRFWVEVKTGAPLGRGAYRNVTYRVGDEPPTTTRWQYTSRTAVPAGLFEERHLVDRIIEHKAERAIFRLTTYDGSAHDVTAPIDAAARAAMADVVAKCQT